MQEFFYAFDCREEGGLGGDVDCLRMGGVGVGGGRGGVEEGTF